MKNLNILIATLIACAVPAMAFGQSVTCDVCTHDVSVYYGSGGFIAETDADEVVWVASCNGVTVSGEEPPNDDGIVSMLFNDENGLSCDDDDEKNRFQLGPVNDGGWFWITDEKSSAIGSLVSHDVLDNEPVMPVKAGDGVTMMPGRGAYYLKETATGRVGVFPTILPEPPTEALRKCGFSGAATTASPAKPINTGCALGDGKTITLATITDGLTGDVRRIHDKGTITRPSGTGSIEIEVDLWGNGTGHYVTTHDPDTDNGISAMRGQSSVALEDERASTRLTGVTYVVRRGGQGAEPGVEVMDSETEDATDGGAADDGLARTAAGNDMVTITVTSDSDYCSKDNNHPATVTVTAVMATAADAGQITPAVARSTRSDPVGVVGSTSFVVVCRSQASANQGVELVPENPFPTRE